MEQLAERMPETDPSEKRRERTKLRIAILLMILSAVSLYASSIVTRHKIRRTWHRTLNVGVILLGPGGVGIEKKQLIANRLPKLDETLAHEFHKYRPDAPFGPVHFELVGAAGVEEPPPMPPDDGDYLGRAEHAFRLWRYLRHVHKEGDMKVSGYDARLYVMLVPAAPNASRFVEGIGAKDGDVGIIEAQLDESTLDLTLLAIGHEFLHCVGATDKYDPDGHTDSPDDLPEPDKQPRYPQRFAEIMVGEITISPTEGRLPDTLDQVAVGPKTAREVGWVKDAAGGGAERVAAKQ